MVKLEKDFLDYEEKIETLMRVRAAGLKSTPRKERLKAACLYLSTLGIEIPQPSNPAIQKLISSTQQEPA